MKRFLPVLLLTLCVGSAFASMPQGRSLQPNENYDWFGTEGGKGAQGPVGSSCSYPFCVPGEVHVRTDSRGKITKWNFLAYARKPRSCVADKVRLWWNQKGERPMIVRKNGSIRYRTQSGRNLFKLTARVSKDGTRIVGRYTIRYRWKTGVCSSRPIKFSAKTGKTR